MSCCGTEAICSDQSGQELRILIPPAQIYGVQDKFRVADYDNET